MHRPANCTKPALIVGLSGFNKLGLWKSFRDIERSKQWGEMALGFPWQQLQAAKRAALKTYVRLDWSVHSEPSNRFSAQPITLSRTASTVLTFDLLSVSGLKWFRERKLFPLLKKDNFRLPDCKRKACLCGQIICWKDHVFHFPTCSFKDFTATKDRQKEQCSSKS